LLINKQNNSTVLTIAGVLNDRRVAESMKILKCQVKTFEERLNTIEQEKIEFLRGFVQLSEDMEKFMRERWLRHAKAKAAGQSWAQIATYDFERLLAINVEFVKIGVLYGE
jgi:hypothetical protein